MKDFLLRHWVGLVAILGGVAMSWAQWNYVTDQVNPETVLQFRVEQARLDARREVRWCLGKNALEGGSAIDALACADN